MHPIRKIYETLHLCEEISKLKYSLVCHALLTSFQTFNGGVVRWVYCSTPTGNSTYTSCQMSSEDIVNTHDTFLKFLGIELSDDDKRLPYLYWTPKLHKSPVKHHFIAGSSKCSTKQFFSSLTKILTVIKTGLEK